MQYEVIKRNFHYYIQKMYKKFEKYLQNIFTIRLYFANNITLLSSPYSEIVRSIEMIGITDYCNY